VHAQAFVGRDGKHRLLLVSQRDRDIMVPLASAAGATATVVDQTTKGDPARVEKLDGDSFHLPGFGVAIVTWP
jgi:hypothetical protein